MQIPASVRIADIYERRCHKFHVTLFGIFVSFLYFSLITGTHAECPVQLNPERVVVRYDSSVSVNCSTNISHTGIGWEASQGSVSMTDTDNQITWSVSNLREWDIQPQCYINYDDKQCEKYLIITVYKTPDNVSIRTVNHTGPMTEGKEYELLCDITNVAPAQNLTVMWYKGQTLVDQTTFTDTNKKPVNKTAKLQITANRTDNGTQYKCEAELELGADGPQPPPTVTSEPLYITVHYEPFISNINQSKVYVFRGDRVELICKAEGNPKPKVSWISNTNVRTEGGNLIIEEATPDNVGDYNCSANNGLGMTIRKVTVILQEIPDIIVSHTRTMIEGKEYELLCEITNVDPAQILTVKWYKGHILVNQTTFTKTTNNGPVNKTAKLQITANRTDDGAQYKCVAEQELGTPRTLTSRPLNITVHVKPIINETKLPSTVPVFRGYPVVLVCEAVGHPKPDVNWSPTTNVKVVGGNLTITDTLPDNLYTCTANNSAGNTTRIVTVVLKEDYLPLIAGLVAVTVAVISVIFIFIYSIYYKKAKMGHYSLKDAKPSAQNGHIAQNGKDNTIPMKKLSQSNIFA